MASSLRSRSHSQSLTATRDYNGQQYACKIGVPRTGVGGGGEGAVRGYAPRNFLEMNMRWGAIWCILRQFWEKVTVVFDFKIILLHVHMVFLDKG